MLKWAKTPQGSRRISECSLGSDFNFETSSTLSSDSSESGITDLSVPIRYHERRASGRPKSLALTSGDIIDLENFSELMNNTAVPRRAQRTASTGMYSSCSRAKRHSMFVETSSHRPASFSTPTPTNNNNDILKISTTSVTPSPESDEGVDTGVLKISTTSDSVLKISTADCDKPKSRNSFWKNLRAKAQGKKTEAGKKLSKAHSMSNLPAISPSTDTCKAYSDNTPSQQSHEVATPEQTPVTTLSYSTCHSPVIMRRHSQRQVPVAPESMSPATAARNRANVQRRRSFKLIKKQNENKKPKPFSKQMSEFSKEDYPITGSPDSGISSMRLPSNTDSDNEDKDSSPASPITPIDIESSSTDLTCLRQQFTDAVLQYLNERLEHKGIKSIKADRTSAISTASSTQSEDGAGDIFCYNTDTVMRRPSQRQQSQISNQTLEATQ